MGRQKDSENEQQEGSDRIYIDQAEKILDRKMDTLRKWENVLPPDLLPARGIRNRRYWTQNQIDGIKKWIVDTDRRPGKGITALRDHDSDDAIIDRVMAMRKPRTPRYAKRDK